MRALRHRLLTAASAGVLAVALAAHAADPSAPESEPAGDPRQLVSMPEPAQELMRRDMIDHLVVLNQLLAHLAADELEQAGELAEARLGNSSRGRHRGTGMGPGRFMPPEMRGLGMAMHQAASDFAAIAGKQDRKAAYAALQRVTSLCVACHMSFRVR